MNICANMNICTSNSPPSPSPKTLPESLKDDTTRMNDKNKHKLTGQMNHQTADPKANASVFLFLPTAHFLKTILASRTNGIFGFARHTSRPFAKAKEPFFAKRQELFLSFENIKWSRDHFKKREISKSHKIRINN